VVVERELLLLMDQDNLVVQVVVEQILILESGMGVQVIHLLLSISRK
jgi:hypothetical protein